MCEVGSDTKLPWAWVNVFINQRGLGKSRSAVPCVSAIGRPLTRRDDQASRGNKLEC